MSLTTFEQPSGEKARLLMESARLSHASLRERNKHLPVRRRSVSPMATGRVREASVHSSSFTSAMSRLESQRCRLSLSPCGEPQSPIAIESDR